MAKKSTTFNIRSTGRPDLSRLPSYLGLEIIRRLQAKQSSTSTQTIYGYACLSLQLTDKIKLKKAQTD